MNIRHVISTLAVAAAAIIAAAGNAGATSDPNELSPASRALFTSDHLALLKEPAVLVYEFEKKGSLEEGFQDTIEADVTKVWPNGGKDISFHFLSGAHHIQFRDFENYVGNPIFMLFLERDVREMERLTRGKSLYFRNRIRNALAGSTSLTPTSFDFNGKKVQGTEIRIEPYANDPLNERYPRFAKRAYVFVLSDEIPGGIYKINVVTPDPSGTQPLTDESVTFREMHAPEAKRADAGRTPGAEKAKVANKTK